MAYKLIKREYGVYTNADRCEFVADSVADIETLPSCSAGSTCICTEEENTGIYMLGADDAWHKL